MADFVAVLRKTIDGLADNTPALREKVYEKARATVAAKLAAISPPPPAAVAQRQKQVLEDAIRQVEAGFNGTIADPFAELENVFVEPGKAAAPEWAPMPREPRTAPAAPMPYAPPPGPERYVRSVDDLPPDEVEAFEETRPPVPFDGDEDELPDDDGMRFEEPVRRRSFVPLIATVLALALVAGGAYAVWLNRDDFMAMLKMDGSQEVASTPSAAEPVAPPPAAARKSSAVETPPAEEPQKFTQRLNSDGSEVDPGPASGGLKSIGEGTSVAAITQQPETPAPAPDTTPDEATPPAGAATPEDAAPPAADAAPPAAVPPAAAAPDAPAGETAAAPDAGPADRAAAPADTTAPAANPASEAAKEATSDAAAAGANVAAAEAAAQAPAATSSGAAAATDPADAAQVLVGQKAIFYEERTNVAEGSADLGNVVWSLVQESPGNGLPAEAAIHGDATIPGKDLQLRLTIRRNADKTLPASHIIELIFLTPSNFDGGAIDKVLRFTLKETEAVAGKALLSIPPTKVADGYFLVALNDTKAEVETNLGLLRSEQWIDVPVVYSNGRRALITMEKGVAGDKVFDEVIKAWQTAASASAG